MKRFAMAVVLTCVLSVTALAGDIPSTDQSTPLAENPVLMVLISIIDSVAR